jgi:hypothetical protein
MIGSQPAIRAAINPARPTRRPQNRDRLSRRGLSHIQHRTARGSMKKTESCPERDDRIGDGTGVAATSRIVQAE